MSVKALEDDVARALRSSIAITSLNQVVEELVANSLDAKAKQIQITIDIPNWSVTVRDDGMGISPQVVGNPNSTSKLKTLGDLATISTFGFRGEALSAIATHSLVEIVSKQAHARDCFVKTLKGGKSLGVAKSATARTRGTTVTVRDLFFNAPVRRKIGEKRGALSSEADRIRDRVTRLAIIHPDVSFILFDHARQMNLLRNAQAPTMLESFCKVFGNQWKPHLRDVANIQSVGDLALELTGFVSRPIEGNYSKSYQFVYINKRPAYRTDLHVLLQKIFSRYSVVDEPVLWKTLGKTEIECCPIYCLNLTIDPSQIDVTFDPAKTLIKFHNWESVANFVEETVTEGLTTSVDVVAASVLPSTDCDPPESGKDAVNHCSLPKRTKDTSTIPPVIQSRALSEDDRSHHIGDAFGDVIARTKMKQYRQHVTSSLRPKDTSRPSKDARKNVHHEPVSSPTSRKRGDAEAFKIPSNEDSTPSSPEKRLRPSEHRGVGSSTSNTQTSEEVERTHLPDQGVLRGCEPMTEPDDVTIAMFELPSWTPPDMTSNNGDPQTVANKEAAECLSVTDLEPSGDPKSFSKDDLKHMHVIGQADKKYIVGILAMTMSVRESNYLIASLMTRGRRVAIDQHAAHERVRLEAMMRRTFGEDGRSRNFGIVQINPPRRGCMSSEEWRLYETHKHAVKAWGFHLRRPPSSQYFEQEGSFVLSQVPSVEGFDFTQDHLKQYLHQLHGEVTLGKLVPRPTFVIKLLCSKACRGAIMFGDPLTFEECEHIRDDLALCKLPFQCAHGRPTIAPLCDFQQLRELAMDPPET